MGKLLPFSRVVNGIIVDQRRTDGFINGTAMCVAHGKDIANWLKTDDTWELVCAVAVEENIQSKSPKKGISVYTRVSATFPQLVISRQGSPENGGGTWLHPDLAVQLAQWCNKPFAVQVSRWIREWILTGKNPVKVDADQEFEAWQQRYNIRVFLKDFLRPELMNATVCWAQASRISPRTCCSDVHDAMNERIQGAKSKGIKTAYELPLFTLLRDHLDVHPLVSYSAINKLAKNDIEENGTNPIEAVHKACDRYLGSSYIPKVYPKAENLYKKGKRLASTKAKQALIKGIQLQLPLSDLDVS